MRSSKRQAPRGKDIISNEQTNNAERTSREQLILEYFSTQGSQPMRQKLIAEEYGRQLIINVPNNSIPIRTTSCFYFYLSVISLLWPSRSNGKGFGTNNININNWL